MWVEISNRRSIGPEAGSIDRMVNRPFAPSALQSAVREFTGEPPVFQISAAGPRGRAADVPEHRPSAIQIGRSLSTKSIRCWHRPTDGPTDPPTQTHPPTDLPSVFFLTNATTNAHRLTQRAPAAHHVRNRPKAATSSQLEGRGPYSTSAACSASALAAAAR